MRVNAAICYVTYFEQYIIYSFISYSYHTATVSYFLYFEQYFNCSFISYAYLYSLFIYLFIYLLICLSLYFSWSSRSALKVSKINKRDFIGRKFTFVQFAKGIINREQGVGMGSNSPDILFKFSIYFLL